VITGWRHLVTFSTFYSVVTCFRYADDRVEKSHGTWYEGILDKFYDMIQNISARVPYMTSVGNHEHECDFIDYKTRNSVPWRESNSTTPMYYSYTAHRIHFISLSTGKIVELI
jgi:hypothetical protein